MITMRKCIHDYFGIADVSILENGEKVMIIISGITSTEGEMCLQVFTLNHVSLFHELCVPIMFDRWRAVTLDAKVPV